MAYFIFLKYLDSLEHFRKNPHVKIPPKSPSTNFQSLGIFKNQIFIQKRIFLHFRPNRPSGLSSQSQPTSPLPHVDPPASRPSGLRPAHPAFPSPPSLTCGPHRSSSSSSRPPSAAVLRAPATPHQDTTLLPCHGEKLTHRALFPYPSFILYWPAPPPPLSITGAPPPSMPPPVPHHRPAHELPPPPYKSHLEHPRTAPPLLAPSFASLLARASLSPTH
jgi:hypothetical protein